MIHVGIGIGCPLSGPYARLGLEMKQAIELAIEETDAALDGLLIEPTVLDDTGNAAKAAEAGQAFADEASILGVVGHYNSDTTFASARACASQDLLIVTPVGSDPQLTEAGLANVFRYTNRDDITGPAISRYLLIERGRRRAIIVSTGTACGKSMDQAFAETFTKMGGEVVGHYHVNEGQRDFAGLLSAMPQNFDVLFYGGSFEGAPLLRAMRKAGFSQLFAAGDGCWDKWNFLDVAGTAASMGEGVAVLSATPEPGEVLGSAAFAARYARRFGEIGNYAANSYDAAKSLMLAIGKATGHAGKAPGRDAVIETMRSIHYQGIAYKEPVEWNDNGDNLSAMTAIHVIENGAFHQVATA